MKNRVLALSSGRLGNPVEGTETNVAGRMRQLPG